MKVSSKMAEKSGPRHKWVKQELVYKHFMLVSVLRIRTGSRVRIKMNNFLYLYYLSHRKGVRVGAASFFRI
jgi:hypothetical protein